MKTFAQYQEIRQIAEFLITNQINVEEYCTSITELAENDNLNEEKLSDKVQVHPDMQTTADVMTLIAKIDVKIKELGLKADLSQLTFGAVERAMEKWHAIRSRGGNPYEVIAKAKQKKMDDLHNNLTSSQNVGGNYSSDSVSTTNAMQSPIKTSKSGQSIFNGKFGPKLSSSFSPNSPEIHSKKADDAVKYFNKQKQSSLFDKQ